jgi:peptide/nickel transport system ATP-binding protein
LKSSNAASLVMLPARRDVVLDAICGSVPDPSHLPSGCAFHPRCNFFVGGRCDVSQPPLDAV